MTEPPPRNLRLLQALLDTPTIKPVVERVTPPESAPSTEAAKSKRGFISKLKLRHAIIGIGFVALVAIPTAVTTAYMAFVASDQYHSSVSFSVRSIDSMQATDLLGMFSQSSAGSTVSDSYVLLDFILSERMVQLVDEAFGLDRIYAPRGTDYYFGLKSGLPIEDRLTYWQSMVDISFDHSSGIMTLEIKAFEPETAQKVASFVVAQSEKLINELSVIARNETLKVAQTEVSNAEGRLYQTRAAVRSYRDQSQEADPVEGAKLAAQLVASLEQQLVELRTGLSTALTQMGENTPRVRVMRSQIASLEKQLERERQRFGSGSASKQGRSANQFGDVAGRIQQYENLQTQNEFAERAYTSALAALEKARVDAAAKQRYLAVFIKPTLSEFAQYPHRIMDTLLVLLGSLLIWGVLVMGYYNIRDRN
ncbi:RkpR, polysaccharide export protein [Rhizobium sp. NFR07]|uniref:RkpR, polysaccharide export protein n=1 Tax=Rhizobium sp. NFR07 TaxID=1566262 RepID=UPI0011609B58|nr:RkpR, polysaccharide export protein [Rhizobium sp. NFR07]